jgi:glycosyltransferase involved in cell wall biosynthesis
MPSIRAIRDVFSVRRTVKALHLDAVLYHLYATALMVRISTLGLRIRRVHMVAGPLYLESALIRGCERFLARLDSAIICGSRYTWEKYRSLGIAADRLSTIPYGVDLDVFTPPSEAVRAEARAELGYEPASFVAVMVSYVYAPKRMVFAGKGIKGHEDLLSAWPLFARRHSDVALLIVGSGFDAAGEQYRRELLGRIPARELGPRFRWLDSVDDVRLLYSAADLSISPSLSENHGAALEAAAMGVVSVVSDAGALPETIDRGAGWVHSAGSPSSLLDALEEAYGEWESSRLGQARVTARAFMEENFSQRGGARSVIDVLLSGIPAGGR